MLRLELFEALEKSSALGLFNVVSEVAMAEANGSGLAVSSRSASSLTTSCPRS